MQPARTCSHEEELEGLQSEVGRYPGGSRVPRGSCRSLNQKTRVANNEQVNGLKNYKLSENLSANEQDSEKRRFLKYVCETLFLKLGQDGEKFFEGNKN